MAEAWTKRDAKRREFLLNLQKLILDESEKDEKPLLIQLALSALIAEYLAEANGYSNIFPPLHHSTRSLLRSKIIPAIKEFSRSREEGLSLLAELFKWNCGSVIHHFQAPLRSKKIYEPEKV
jgi:hypothetical protein